MQIGDEMTSKIKTLLDEQTWMIHDLVDGDQILNDEETKLIELSESARKEFDKIYRWIEKAHDWFEIQDDINVNSVAYRELEQIWKEIR